MLTKRIIPCPDVTLDEAGSCLVKGIGFEDLSRAGDPVELAKEYNFQGADELVFLDITASSSSQNYCNFNPKPLVIRHMKNYIDDCIRFI